MIMPTPYTPLVLAIDAGGTTVKVALFDATGRIIGHRNAEVTTLHYPDGRVERDGHTFWQATRQTIRELLTEDIAQQVVAVGCTGFGNGIFLIDEAGQPTRPGIVSVDHRAQPLVDRLSGQHLSDELSRENGHRPWGGQTLFQLAGLAEDEPEIMGKTRWGLACKDFIRFCLTDEAITDPSDASGGGLMNLQRQDYSTEALELLGHPELAERLPPVVKSSAPAGRISARAAKDTGLPEGIPVAGSMMDVAACALGAGVVSDQHMVFIAGTWAINALEVTRPVSGNYPLLNMLYRDGAARLVAEGSPSSAANLGWYLKNAMGDHFTVEQALALAEGCAIDSQRCYFMPYIHGPKPNQGSFMRLSASDNHSSMIRAICEGVAFEHRRHAETLMEYSDKRWPETIRLTGGAARSPFWAQIFSDVANCPVEVVDAPEIGALGAAICAAVAGGLYPSLEIAAGAMSRVSRYHTPDSKNAAILDRRYHEFLRLDRGIQTLLNN